MALIFISAGSPECSLSDEVWKHTQLKETAKWQAGGLGHSLLHIKSGLFCLLLCTVMFSWGLQAPLLILVCQLCNPLKHIRLPYTIMKGEIHSFNIGYGACNQSRGCSFWNSSNGTYLVPGYGDEIENQNWVCREEVGTRAPVGVCRTRCCWCLDACNQRATHLLNCYNQKSLIKRNKYYVDSMMKFWPT